MALWKNRLEDDGAARTSETALRRIADALLSDAVQGLPRAVLEGDLHRQWRAQVLLELTRLLRVDLHGGGWARLDAGDRRQVRRALLTLGVLAHSRAPIPIA
ncbi:MAG TPA: hypothetical protein VFD38_06120 [Myxococcaceae bacterium]|nr:hypothetical protein [Myxococcaceae bacterium]